MNSTRIFMHKLTFIALMILAIGLWTNVAAGGLFKMFITVPSIYFICVAIKENNFKLPKSVIAIFLFAISAWFSTFINLDDLLHTHISLRKPSNLLVVSLPVFAMKYYLKEYFTQKQAKYLFGGLLISAFIASVIGYFNMKYNIRFEKMQAGNFNNRLPGLTGVAPYTYAVGFFTFIFFFISYYYEQLSQWIVIKRKWFIMMTVFCLLCTIRGDSRGAILGLVAVMGIFVFLKNKKIGLSILLLSSLSIPFFIYYGLKNPELAQTTRMFSWDFDGGSNDGERIKIYKFALKHIPEKLLFGHGIFSFKSKIIKLNEGLSDEKKMYEYGNAHNLFLVILYEQGIIGLVLFGLFIFFILKEVKHLKLSFLFASLFTFHWIIAFQGNCMYYNDVHNTFTINFIYLLLIAISLNHQKTSDLISDKTRTLNYH